MEMMYLDIKFYEYGSMTFSTHSGEWKIVPIDSNVGNHNNVCI